MVISDISRYIGARNLDSITEDLFCSHPEDNGEKLNHEFGILVIDW